MQTIAGVMTSVRALATVSIRVATWNRRLLIAAAVFVLWGACVLALQAAGPHAQAMIAGEGMLITETE
jgi:hypothetical protein